MLIPLSRQAVQAAQASYQSGQSGRVGLTLVLEAARDLIDHRLEYERYSADHGQRLAELEAAVGGAL